MYFSSDSINEVLEQLKKSCYFNLETIKRMIISIFLQKKSIAHTVIQVYRFNTHILLIQYIVIYCFVCSSSCISFPVCNQ